MPYTDPEKQRDYQRNWQRRRSAAGEGSPKALSLADAERFTTAAGVMELLAEVLAEVQASGGDAMQRARCIAYVAGVQMRAIETADLEARLTALEEAAVGDRAAS
mgnify:CR=1 FL=1